MIRYCLLIVALALPVTTFAAEPVEFVRDVRPILSDKCYTCHGPDEESREADLRFDIRDDAEHVLSPGDPDESELVARITSSDPDAKMPPATSKLALSEAEIATLRQWVAEGAPYEQHWSFTPLSELSLPRIRNQDWPTNPIDFFILARLEREGFEPAPPAAKVRLVRRLSFDLTGLPPTIAEIDQFVSDTGAGAYERLVDRLLSKKQFGERMASDWLDVARYSDTYGYQVDRDRFVWPWRDWVINAFNQNLSYDRFVTYQLAGDLLPSPTDEQILATTFNRLHPQKVEGGSVPEEFRVEYVADRNHTFATAFLGLTLECARCHEHKYDPITQREYYQLFAFFNSIDEAGLYSYFTSSVPTPTMLLTDDKVRESIDRTREQIERAELALESCAAQQEAGFDEWLSQRPSEAPIRGELQHLDFESESSGPNKSVDGPVGRAIQLSGDDGIGLKVGNFTRNQSFSVSFWMNTPDLKERAVVFHRSRAWTDAASRGYQLLLEQGRLSASLIHFWPGNAIRVRTKAPVAIDEWVYVTMTYDGSSRADGLSLFINGKPEPVDIVRDNLYKNITGGGGDNIRIGERFRDRGFTGGKVDEFRVYDRRLTEIEVAQVYDGMALQTALETKTDDLSPQQRQQLREFYLNTINNDYQASLKQLQQVREQRSKTVDGIQEIMVMRELASPRNTYRLKRGAYDAPAEEVRANTPAFLPTFPEDQPRNRLGLARWLTSPDHPLMARVTVNRFWQQCFGQGLVQTPEDFGSQGTPPTHPALLDWMAKDFVENGWDVKRLIKMIVMSSTYRQDSTSDEIKQRRDPENLLLARGPRYRQSAEMIRDNALAVSGLLVDKVGGAPVRPYEVAVSFKPLKPDSGEGLYRRSLYTFWKRTAPAPVMMALDASKRDVCVVKRERTSSPLQAFVLLNDPQFVEASRVLAQQLLLEHGDNTEAWIAQAFRRMTSRRPSPTEVEILLGLWTTQLRHFEQHPDKAASFLKTGEAPVEDKIPAARIAAAASVISTLFSFDECVMKR